MATLATYYRLGMNPSGPIGLKYLNGQTMDGVVNMTAEIGPVYSGTRWVEIPVRNGGQAISDVFLMCFGSEQNPKYLFLNAGFGTTPELTSTVTDNGSTTWIKIGQSSGKFQYQNVYCKNQGLPSYLTWDGNGNPSLTSEAENTAWDVDEIDF